METSNTEFIKMEVQRGEGIAFLVESAVLLELEQGLLTSLPIHDQSLFLDVSIAYLKNQKLSPPATAFLETLSNLGWSRYARLGYRGADGENPRAPARTDRIMTVQCRQTFPVFQNARKNPPVGRRHVSFFCFWS